MKNKPTVSKLTKVKNGFLLTLTYKVIVGWHFLSLLLIAWFRNPQPSELFIEPLVTEVAKLWEMYCLGCEKILILLLRLGFVNKKGSVFILVGPISVLQRVMNKTNELPMTSITGVAALFTKIPKLVKSEELFTGGVISLFRFGLLKVVFSWLMGFFGNKETYRNLDLYQVDQLVWAMEHYLQKKYGIRMEDRLRQDLTTVLYATVTAVTKKTRFVQPDLDREQTLITQIKTDLGIVQELPVKRNARQQII